MPADDKSRRSTDEPAEKQKPAKEMTVREAGRKGGERVRQLIEEAKRTIVEADKHKRTED